MDISAAFNTQPIFLSLLFLFEQRGGEKMTIVTLRQNESQDQLLKRFRKKVVKSGVLSTVRRKRWFVSKSELRRIERKKAIRRFKRRQSGKVYEPAICPVI
jgi:small subunit ribosomal protein S21